MSNYIVYVPCFLCFHSWWWMCFTINIFAKNFLYTMDSLLSFTYLYRRKTCEIANIRIVIFVYLFCCLFVCLTLSICFYVFQRRKNNTSDITFSFLRFVVHFFLLRLRFCWCIVLRGKKENVFHGKIVVEIFCYILSLFYLCQFVLSYRVHLFILFFFK